MSYLFSASYHDIIELRPFKAFSIPPAFNRLKSYTGALSTIISNQFFSTFPAAWSRSKIIQNSICQSLQRHKTI